MQDELTYYFKMKPFHIVTLIDDDNHVVTPNYKSVDAQGDAYDPEQAYTANYWALYFNWLSVIVHLVVMAFAMQWWCNSSKIAMIYTAQFLVLHSLCWAIPDRRYF